MPIEKEIQPSSQSTQDQQASCPKWYSRAKCSRKKKFIVLVIVASASALGAFIYLDKSPDPTTWESMRTDYKNTK